MSKKRIAVLIVVLVAALGVALSVKAVAAQAPPPAAPAAYDVAHGPDIVGIPGTLNVYVSENTLWRQFYHAAEYHHGADASKLLRIINMRHEHRVGLPR